MLSVSPFSTFAKPLRSLGDWLLENHYSQHAAEAIVAHAGEHGTPTGSCLYPEDEGAASAVFVDAMDEVDFGSAEWSGSDEGPGDSDRSIPAGAAIVPTELLDLAPVCGGGPEPFEPSEADWADYRGWALGIESRARLARRSDPQYGYE